MILLPKLPLSVKRIKIVGFLEELKVQGDIRRLDETLWCRTAEQSLFTGERYRC